MPPSSRAGRTWRCLLLGVLASLWLASAAQANRSRNAAILARVLSFELTLEERAGGSVVVAVIYKRGDARSEANANEWLEGLHSLASVRIKDRPFSATKVAYGTAELAAAIDRGGADVLLVADGLTAELDAIAELARSRHVLTASNNVADVAKAVTLCVTDDGDKIKIVINLNTARLEGIRFSSNLLKLATLIR